MPDLPKIAALPQVSHDELREVGEMAARIWPGAYGKLISRDQIEYMLEKMYAVETLSREVSEGISIRWVACDSKRVGFLAFGPVSPGRSCFLHKLYVECDQQGRGYGAAALNALHSDLKESGVRSLDLRVNRNNESAIAFYLKNDFLVTGEDCLDIGNGFVMDDFLMQRLL